MQTQRANVGQCERATKYDVTQQADISLRVMFRRRHVCMKLRVVQVLGLYIHVQVTSV